jgi:hypothetical protein
MSFCLIFWIKLNENYFAYTTLSNFEVIAFYIVMTKSILNLLILCRFYFKILLIK